MILVGQSRIHGQGAFAAKDFEEGEQIGVYEGKRYSARQVARRNWETGLTYVFGLSDGSVIDAAIGGNSTKHLNHSCAPNCEALEEVGPDGETLVVFYALRPIRAGDELFLDYSLVVDETEEREAFKCSCGTARCRGTMLAVS
ncbi:MAG TPA: SET domain-containing protein-lysine N-methyltransferase [Burkholderiaceae bacterium]|nr:SET domain-containing protein-lysine N-methyltransferase [Burkholderiaceae bacterium]